MNEYYKRVMDLIKQVKKFVKLIRKSVMDLVMLTASNNETMHLNLFHLCCLHHHTIAGPVTRKMIIIILVNYIYHFHC